MKKSIQQVFFVISISTMLILGACGPMPTNTPDNTIATVTDTATHLQPPECAQKNLTQEECANLGAHDYSFSEPYTYDSLTNSTPPRF
jgi:hypothetical protein